MSLYSPVWKFGKKRICSAKGCEHKATMVSARPVWMNDSPSMGEIVYCPFHAPDDAMEIKK